MRRFLAVLTLAATLAGPAFAAEKLVPADAAGALGEHRGKPWREPLTNCAGFHGWYMRNLEEAGDSKAAREEAGRAAEFTNAAAGRIGADEGLTVDEAKSKNQRRIQNVVTSLDMAMVPPDGAAWTRHCQEVLAGYRKAFG